MLSQTDREAFGAFEKKAWDRAADLYHRDWGPLTKQSVEPLLNAAQVRSGMRILDVATGGGYAAAAAHKRGALAIGIDFSQRQIELARRTYPGIEFRQANAEKIPFEPDSFDAVVMALGMLHLLNPEDAFSEAFRVLKPDGIFAHTVWARPEDNPGFAIVLKAIEGYGEKIDMPPSPPYFRFADQNEAVRAFHVAGFIDVHMKMVQQAWHHADADQLFDAFNVGAVRVAAILRAQPAYVRDRIRTAVREKVSALWREGRYVVPAPVVLSFGRKPMMSEDAGQPP
jgi:SAM-dependent methyltransferase